MARADDYMMTAEEIRLRRYRRQRGTLSGSFSFWDLVCLLCWRPRQPLELSAISSVLTLFGVNVPLAVLPFRPQAAPS